MPAAPGLSLPDTGAPEEALYNYRHIWGGNRSTFLLRKGAGGPRVGLLCLLQRSTGRGDGEPWS